MFQKTFKKLVTTDDSIAMYDLAQRVIYYADTPDLDLFKSNRVILRYRRNNQLLETVLKVRNVTLQEAEELKEKYAHVTYHTIKIEWDHTGTSEATLTLSLKYNHPSVPSGLSFFFNPADFLSAHQQSLLGAYINITPSDLRFMIPIQSKCFLFETTYKEFESIVLEERKLPNVFGKRLYELSFKTQTYTKKTFEHFLAYLNKGEIIISDEPTYKTTWFYKRFFGI